MALVERGDLSLDDQVEQFLPGLVDAKDPVLLLRDLLLHTSGLPGQVRLYRDSATPAELYAAIGRLPRESAPGTRVTYSSQGSFCSAGLPRSLPGQGCRAWSLSWWRSRPVLRPCAIDLAAPIPRCRASPPNSAAGAVS